MATEVKLPRLGQGMESGTIVKWLKSEGDKVEKGEPLYELDTDKVTQEVEADASGVLLKIAVSEGEVEVGKTIAVIGEQGEEVAAEPRSRPATGQRPGGRRATRRRKALPRARVKQDREQGRRASAGHERAGRPRSGSRPVTTAGASRPRRWRAGSHASAGSTSARVAGTGPDGRVVAEDVERAAASAAAAPAAQRRPPPRGGGRSSSRRCARRSRAG